MINLFKNIRQKLFAENRFGRYLLYAIGEIFFVGISILIALQVINWNSLQKHVRLEKEYNCRLQEDVAQNKEQTDNLMPWPGTDLLPID